MKKNLRHFSRFDFDDFSKMNYKFLKILDRARHVIKHSCNVLVGYATKGHSPRSEHYKNPCSASDDFYSSRLLKYKVSSKDIGILHRNLDKLILKTNKRGILQLLILKYLSGIKRIGFYPYGIPRTYFHNDLKESKTDFWIGLTISSLLEQIGNELDIPNKNLEFILNRANKKGKHKLYIYPK